MALKNKYTNLKEIPAEDVRLYVERDGAWVLDAEFGGDKAKLDEFRTNNIALLKELNEFKQRFDGVDPDAVRTLAAEKQRLEEEKKLKAGEFDQVLDGRLKAAKGEWDKQFAKVSSDNEALSARLTLIQIDQGVTATATKRGLRPTAIPDITSRARTVFRLVDGVPTAFEADGKTVRPGKDGVAPMTLEEWIDTQVSEAPHLFESNAGGGGGGATSHYGNGSGGVGNRSVKNPFTKENWNLTHQMQLQKTDPQLAARLKASA